MYGQQRQRFLYKHSPSKKKKEEKKRSLSLTVALATYLAKALHVCMCVYMYMYADRATQRYTEALEAATASLSVEAQKRAAKDAQKKAAQAEKAEQKQASKMANSVITIKRVERNKRKFVTAVQGLEAFNLDLKKVRPRPPRPFSLSLSARHG